jgi:hypothetical protein
MVKTRTRLLKMLYIYRVFLVQSYKFKRNNVHSCWGKKSTVSVICNMFRPLWAVMEELNVIQQEVWKGLQRIK